MSPFNDKLIAALVAANASDALVAAANEFVYDYTPEMEADATQEEVKTSAYKVFLEAFQQFLVIAKKDTVTLEDGELAAEVCSAESDTGFEELPVEEVAIPEEEVKAMPEMVPFPTEEVTQKIYPSGDLVEDPIAQAVAPVETEVNNDVTTDPVVESEVPATEEEVATAEETQVTAPAKKSKKA